MHANSHTPTQIQSLVTRPRPGAVWKTHESNIGMEKKKTSRHRQEELNPENHAGSVAKTEEFPL